MSGHSFLPNDGEFCDVECKLRHQQRLYVPEDIIKVMIDCRKRNKFVVTRMSRHEFLSTTSLEQCSINRKIDISGDTISWLKTREIYLSRKNPDRLYLSETFDISDRREIGIGKRLKNSNNQSLLND